MMSQLKRDFDCEILACFIIYLAYLAYGLWNLIGVREAILTIAQFDFAPGWLGEPRDDSNDELENFNSFLQSWWQWYVLHTMISIVVTRFWPQRRNLGHIFVSAVALICTVRLLFIAVLLCQLLSYYAVAQKHSKVLTWLLSVIWMLVINMIKNSEMWFNTLGYAEYFTLIITLSWSLLRCCSFVFSKLQEKAHDDHIHLELLYSIENFFGYALYFPCLVYGPFLGYKRYVVIKSQNRVYHKSMRSKLLKLLFELVRVGFWWLVMQLALHFLYVHYMARDVAAVKLVTPTFGRHAIGYFMGQFFFLYYVVTYGVGIAFANFDELEPPHRPRCIGIIHSYSDMWKYFDEGLYEFLFRHIYAEICRKNSSLGLKLLATAATFAFVFVWHGCYTYVLIWSVLNFSCLVAEKSFKALVASQKYQHWSSTHLTPRNCQRLYAFLATQLFIPAAFSNVYFISGLDVGNYLMRGAYLSGFWNYMALTFCSYCFFQCAEVISKRRNSHSNTQVN